VPPAGKRLGPFLPEIVEVLERTGERTFTAEVRAKLERISPATIDRMLAPERSRLRVRGRSGTKPGSILKRQIPIRTFADWDDARPGFCEVDLVAHDGGNASGEFCQTLVLTCVATGWTEMRALRNKAQRWSFAAITDIEHTLPFPLLGLDSDIRGRVHQRPAVPVVHRQRGHLHPVPSPPQERQLLRRAEELPDRAPAGRLHALRHRIRARPPHRALRSPAPVRELLRAPDEPPRQDPPDAKVTKRYDRARTPYRRALASPDVTEDAKAALTATYLELNPVALRRRIGALQDELLHVNRTKSPKEVKRSPSPHQRFELHPSLVSRTFPVRQPEGASRTS
jgi:hypothetical protein